MHTNQPQPETTRAHNDNEYITFAEAAKITPGRPSANAMWRWARRGVLSRGGDRIRLEHARVGGKIFTKPVWVQQFGERLASSDTAHFQRRSNGHGQVTPTPIPGTPQQSDLEREFQEEGL